MENLAEENYPREFNLIEVLSIAWNVFTKNYFRLFGFIFSIAFPIAIIDAIYLNPLMKDLLLQLNTAENNPHVVMEILLHFMNNSDFNIILFSTVLLTLILYGVVFNVLKSILFETELRASHIFSKTLIKLPQVLIVAIIMGLLLLISFSMLIVPGIIVFTYFYFTLILIYSENTTIFNSFKRSFELVRGRFLMTFIAILALFILNYLVTLILNLANIVSTELSYKIILTLVNGIASTYFKVAQYVLFVNYRDTAHFYSPQIPQE